MFVPVSVSVLFIYEYSFCLLDEHGDNVDDSDGDFWCQGCVFTAPVEAIPIFFYITSIVIVYIFWKHMVAIMIMMTKLTMMVMIYGDSWHGWVYTAVQAIHMC